MNDLAPMATMQRSLYQALGLAAALAVALGLALRLPAWGYSFAIGCLASGIYFFFLGRQVARTLVADGRVAPFQVVAFMLARQAVCAVALLVCLRLWGPPWWACLAALLIARHWVMVVAHPRTA